MASSSSSSGGGGGWWATLTSSVEQLASDLEKTIMDTAMAAQNELAAEQAKIKQESMALRAASAADVADSRGAPSGEGTEGSTATTGSSDAKVALLPLYYWSRLPYPWETAEETRSILTDGLMQDVLTLLPFAEKNFTMRPSDASFEHLLQQFDLSRFVSMSVRLLQLDGNLARMHAKISPRMDEVEFWRNYFMRIAYLRAACGIDGPEAQQGVGSLPRESVLFTAADNPIVHAAPKAPRVTPPSDSDAVASLEATIAEAAGGILGQITSVWGLAGLTGSDSSSSASSSQSGAAWDGDAARAAELAAAMKKQSSEPVNEGHEYSADTRLDGDEDDGDLSIDQPAPKGAVGAAGGADEDDIDGGDDDLAAEILAELQDEIPQLSSRSTPSPSLRPGGKPAVPVVTATSAVTAAATSVGEGEDEEDEDDLEAQIARELAEEEGGIGAGAGGEDDLDVDDIDLSDDDFVQVDE